MAKTKDNLLALLNKKFGFPDAKAATYRKVKQFYDEDKAQHVIFIELRISRGEKSVANDPYAKKNQRIIHQLLNMTKRLKQAG